MFWKYFIFFMIYAFYSMSNIRSTSLKNYGTFNLSITGFSVCRGPKQKDCAIATARVSSHHTLLYEITVKKNTSPSHGKIVAMANGKEFLRLQVKKTCEHLFLRPLIGAMLNVTDDCVVLKGHYQFTIDIQDIAQSYFGGTFLFGNWTFKSLFYSNECNFSCSTIEVTIFPINKEN